MGFLAGVGEAAGAASAIGGGSAAGAAGASFGTGAAGTVLSMGGDIFSGIGGLQQGLFAAHIARMNAEAALTAGQTEESASKMKYGALASEQKAAFAANGVSVDSGSPAAVIESTRKLSALDAAMIHYNAAREAFGEKAQASLDKRAAFGALTKGFYDAGNSFLSGANSLADKWQTFKLSGASAGGTP